MRFESVSIGFEFLEKHIFVEEGSKVLAIVLGLFLQFLDPVINSLNTFLKKSPLSGWLSSGRGLSLILLLVL